MKWLLHAMPWKSQGRIQLLVSVTWACSTLPLHASRNKGRLWPVANPYSLLQLSIFPTAGGKWWTAAHPQEEDQPVFHWKKSFPMKIQEEPTWLPTLPPSVKQGSAGIPQMPWDEQIPPLLGEESSVCLEWTRGRSPQFSTPTHDINKCWVTWPDDHEQRIELPVFSEQQLQLI